MFATAISPFVYAGCRCFFKVWPVLEGFGYGSVILKKINVFRPFITSGTALVRVGTGYGTGRPSKKPNVYAPWYGWYGSRPLSYPPSRGQSIQSRPDRGPGIGPVLPAPRASLIPATGKRPGNQGGSKPIKVDQGESNPRS